MARGAGRDVGPLPELGADGEEDRVVPPRLLGEVGQRGLDGPERGRLPRVDRRGDARLIEGYVDTDTLAQAVADAR